MRIPGTTAACCEALLTAMTATWLYHLIQRAAPKAAEAGS